MEDGEEVEVGLHKEVVVTGFGDGDEGFLFRGRKLKERFPMFEWDDLICFAINDEKGGGNLGDAFEIGESISGEDGDLSHGAEGTEERGDENDAAMFLSRCEPASGAGSDGLADDDDVGCFGAESFGEVLVGGFSCAVAAFFGGLAAAFAVPGVVVGDDAEALDVE